MNLVLLQIFVKIGRFKNCISIWLFLARANIFMAQLGSSWIFWKCNFLPHSARAGKFQLGPRLIDLFVYVSKYLRIANIKLNYLWNVRKIRLILILFFVDRRNQFHGLFNDILLLDLKQFAHATFSFSAPSNKFLNNCKYIKWMQSRHKYYIFHQIVQ